MIRHLILAAGISIICQVAVCQQAYNHDSLMTQLKQMTVTVDSLRKKSDDLFKVHESLEKKVTDLAHRKDSATNGLARWRRAYNRQTIQLDSTLLVFDSCIGVLNRLTKLAESAQSQKNRKN